MIGRLRKGPRLLRRDGLWLGVLISINVGFAGAWWVLDAMAANASTPRGAACLGPFASAEVADDYRSGLPAGDGGWQVIAGEFSPHRNTLVYVDTLGSGDTARRLRTELAGLQIEAALIRSGDLPNALAVGVFADDERAGAMSGRLAALGFDSASKRYTHARPVYYVASGADAGAIVFENCFL